MKLRHIIWAIALALASAPMAAHAQTTAQAAPAAKHKLAIQVDEKNPAVMNLALNNAQNVIAYYNKKGESVDVQIVTYGPGLHMLRADTSPVKDRIAAMSMAHPNLRFVACGNTLAGHEKAENTKISLLSEAQLEPSGVVTLMELQGKGYAYVRP